MTDLRTVSRSFLTEFIALYRDLPCLWKIKSKEYSNKHKKNVAYGILVDKLKEIDPSACKEAVVKKINSLRTCFRKEFIKVEQSKKSGLNPDEIRKPNLWYFDLLSFVADQETTRRGLGQRPEVMEIIEDEIDVSQFVKTENDYSEPTTPESNVWEQLVEPHDVPRTLNNYSVSANQVIDRPNEVFELHTEGKYASYGKHIGEELKELPAEMAIYCKKIISDALFMAQMGTLTQYSKIVNDNFKKCE